MTSQEDESRGPTLGTINKVRDYVKENGTKEDPIVANDIHKEADGIGASHEDIKAALDHLVENGRMGKDGVQRGTRTFDGYFWKEVRQG